MGDTKGEHCPVDASSRNFNAFANDPMFVGRVGDYDADVADALVCQALGSLSSKIFTSLQYHIAKYSPRHATITVS